MATAPKKQSTTKFRDEFSDTLSRLEELVEHASDDDLAQIGARLAEYLPTTNVAHQLTLPISLAMKSMPENPKIPSLPPTGVKGVIHINIA